MGLTEARLTVLGVERLAGKGRLFALAVAEIEIAGVPIILQGVQVRRQPDGKLSCDAPCFRGPDGRWLPAVVLTPDLGQALAEMVLAALRPS